MDILNRINCWTIVDLIIYTSCNRFRTFEQFLMLLIILTSHFLQFVTIVSIFNNFVKRTINVKLVLHGNIRCMFHIDRKEAGNLQAVIAKG